MKKTILLISVVFIFTGCYEQLSMEGFDKEKWITYRHGCSQYRLEIAQHIIDNQKVLLEGTQNEIESLLGKAKEHELYERNQKYFHYRLTPPDSCGEFETHTFLSIRFNAMGRANMVQIMLRDPST
ncbi:MAG: hypothetical protein AAF620_02575 [Bacteroidota bacterium]